MCQCRSIGEGIELIDVVARAVPEERLKLDALPDLTVITPAGNAVPLSQVADGLLTNRKNRFAGGGIAKPC